MGCAEYETLHAQHTATYWMNEVATILVPKRSLKLKNKRMRMPIFKKATLQAAANSNFVKALFATVL
jgi:hypothetical protein